MDNYYVKSKFLLKLTTVKEVDQKLKVIGTQLIQCKGKDFYNSLREEERKGIKHSIKMVTEEPKQFRINELYIRLDGKKVWSFIKQEDDKDGNENV